MDLNWEAIRAIGEILGAIAVVATILYLAKETRTNTPGDEGPERDPLPLEDHEKALKGILEVSKGEIEKAERKERQRRKRSRRNHTGG